MGKACLVTGKSTELLAKVAGRTTARERRTLVARSGALEMASVGDEVTVISWNRRSALSARSAVLHAQNLYGRLDEAVIVFSPVRESVPFHESSIVSIENRTDAEVKGYLFMMREILALFQKQGFGTLLLAVLEQESELQSPLEAMSYGGFVSGAEAMQRYYMNEPLEVRLCSTQSDDTDGYAQHIVDILEAPPSRRPRVEWQRYQTRGRIFSRAR